MFTGLALTVAKGNFDEVYTGVTDDGEYHRRGRIVAGGGAVVTELYY